MRSEVFGKGFGADGGFEDGLLGIELGSVGAGGGDGPVGIGGGDFVFPGVGGLEELGGGGLLLEDGVGLELRLEESLEFQGGGLEKLEGVLDLGGDGGGLAQAGLQGNGHEEDFGIGVGLKKGKRVHG